MSMSKSNYKSIVEIIVSLPSSPMVRYAVLNHFADKLEADNPKFDKERFNSYFNKLLNKDNKNAA